MGSSFPADGWPRHVTWTGRWRLPQRVRAGLEILLSPAPLSISALSLPVELTLFSWAPLFFLPLLFLRVQVRLHLADPSQLLQSCPVSPLCTRRVEDSTREGPIPGPFAPLASLHWGRRRDTDGGKEVPYCICLLGRSIEGSLLWSLITWNDSPQSSLGLLRVMVPGLNLILFCLARLVRLSWQ